MSRRVRENARSHLLHRNVYKYLKCLKNDRNINQFSVIYEYEINHENIRKEGPRVTSAVNLRQARKGCPGRV